MSLGVPDISWTSNNLSTSTPGVNKLLCVVQPKSSLLSGITNTSTFIVTSSNTLHQIHDYYVGYIIEDAAFLNRRRIVKYTYLGSYSSYDRAEMTVDSAFPETFVPTNQIYLYDPTDFTNSLYPILFVPLGGKFNEFSYANLVVYNETINDYCAIKSYNDTTNCVLLDTTTHGAVTSWGYNDNYSIRRELPHYPTILNDKATILSSTNTTVVTDIVFSQEIVNKFIRILPNIYNYNLPEPENKCARIVGYDNLTNTITFFPGFETPAPTGFFIEILNFSFDNLCPFVYTGSVLSQQEVACYEIDLLSLVLPTEVLSVANGGNVTYYSHLYVELSNSCSNGIRNIIYSNNPNSTRALFRVPLFDIQEAPHRIKVNSGASQTVKFKPNDNLYFAVYMPSGEIFDSVIPEKFSPSPPEDRIQLSAMFSIRKLN